MNDIADDRNAAAHTPPPRSRADAERREAHATSERISRQKRLGAARPSRDDLGRAALITLVELHKSNRHESILALLTARLRLTLVEVGFCDRETVAVIKTLLADERKAKEYWKAFKRFSDAKRKSQETPDPVRD